VEVGVVAGNGVPVPGVIIGYQVLEVMVLVYLEKMPSPELRRAWNLGKLCWDI
jgi:hypothetical protein